MPATLMWSTLLCQQQFTSLCINGMTMFACVGRLSVCQFVGSFLGRNCFYLYTMITISSKPLSTSVSRMLSNTVKMQVVFLLFLSRLEAQLSSICLFVISDIVSC